MVITNQLVNWFLMVEKISGHFTITPHLNRYDRAYALIKTVGAPNTLHSHLHENREKQ